MPPHALLRPGVAIPFALTALIWGSTWIAIKDQLDVAPASWSVAWRFVLAAGAMFAFAAIARHPLRMGRAAHLVAAALGIMQFSLNYNFVYQAETHLTSGVVAVLYSLLVAGNAILARVFLGEAITPRFIAGSCIAMAGVGLLLVHEARLAPMGGAVWWGVALCLAGISCAAAANVAQSGKIARQYPIVSLLAWAMLYGAIADVALAWVLAGPPVLPTEPRYLAGVAFLAILGSVVTFPIYYHVIREIGAGRAGYVNAVVPIVAMVISTLFENYRWSWLAAGGGALALIGMVIALRARSPARKSG